MVELDSCCMHGPSRSAGSLAAVQNVKNVCLVARKVYQNTARVMLAGKGAEDFAVDMGFSRENLLTDDARKIWLLWKESNSQMNWWGRGMDSPAWKDPYASRSAPMPLVNQHELPKQGPGAQSAPLPILPGPVLRHPTPEWAETIRVRAARLTQMAADLGIPPADRPYAVEQVLWAKTGTIHVSAVNAKGEMSGATTTSGLTWKLPGRVGDSPIIGAGCYTDQDVGSAGATGSGEENIKVAGAHTIVELMRQGLSPKDAGVSLWSTSASGHPRVFAVHDGTYRVEKCTYLFEGSYIPWPPI